MASKTKNSKKYYAVARGRSTGIYESWPLCKEQVHGYSNAVYKGFSNISDALEYMQTGVLDAEMRKCRQRMNSLHSAIEALKGTSGPSIADLY